jgi:hypothetical protein
LFVLIIGLSPPFQTVANGTPGVLLYTDGFGCRSDRLGVRMQVPLCGAERAMTGELAEHTDRHTIRVRPVWRSS